MPALQGSLIGHDEPVALGPLAGRLERVILTHGAWVDLLPGWLTGADAVFDELVHRVDWRAERRQMYDNVVDVPRLLRFYGEEEPLPLRILERARAVLSEHYRDELGSHFATTGMCLYRDGRDSVAWHGDKNGRNGMKDTMVAIVSVGSPRWLGLRPKGGGATHRYALGHGDLIVMGGSCQRTWEHGIAKTARDVGPRISIQFRPPGVF